MKNYKLILLGAIAFTLMGCPTSSTSYSAKSRAEKKLIANYFSRNGIQVVETLPTDSEFYNNPKLYFHVQVYSGEFYFHLNKRGPKTYYDEQGKLQKADSLLGGEQIWMYYKQYTLDENPDTVSVWSTLDSADPISFIYQRDYTAGCEGWHLAAQYMGFSGSECTCIVPSRIGFARDQTTVTPYGYILSMGIHQ